MAKPLSPARRSELRGEAHKLKPVVLVGDKGLTEEVIAEIDRSLDAHELIKVRASAGEREQRDIWLETICERLEAHPVQQIGKVFVIYRENVDPMPPASGLPRQAAPAGPGARDDGAQAGGKKRRPRGEVVGGRGREAQRARDAEKQRLRDIREMKAKGKIPAHVKLDPGPSPRGGGRGDEGATRTSRPRSRTPSPLPASGPRRRRPRTSR
jgi:putative YhbY family RNA-binding protein